MLGFQSDFSIFKENDAVTHVCYVCNNARNGIRHIKPPSARDGCPRAYHFINSDTVHDAMLPKFAGAPDYLASISVGFA